MGVRSGAVASGAPSDVRGILALTRAELRIMLRTAAFRATWLALLALGFVVGNEPGRGVSFSAYNTGEAAWQYLGFVAIAWMSILAVRETSLRTTAIVYTKPQPTERLVATRFVAGYIQVLAALLGLFLGALIGREYGAGNLSGVSAYGVQYLRVAGVLFVASTASYCLALLADSAVAGALVGLFWIVTISGKEYLAKLYFPAYTQNLPAYLPLGVALVGIAAYFHRRSRRGGASPERWIAIVTIGGLALSGWMFRANVLNSHDPLMRINPSLDLMSQQNIVIGERTPGFLLPDQNGRPTSLSDFPDHILIIALWSPRDLESAYLLSRLEDIHRRYGSRGVLPIAICLSEDIGAGNTFARGENLSFPVVSDWGTHNAPRLTEISPLASAYQASILPRVVVTDRSRRVRQILMGISSYDGPDLEREVQRRLSEEPR